MAVKIRLQRHGKKGKPFYQIVAADARSKRDGKFIERLGSYNPNTNPATILLDNERALHWLQVGAIPTDTSRAILSYKGVLYMHHLAKGVAKGVITQEVADQRFNQWLSEKEAKIEAKKNNLSAAAEKDLAERFQKEREIQEARAREIVAANTPAPEVVEEEVSEEAEKAPAAEEVAEAEEAPAAEEVAEAEEAPAAEETNDETKAAE